MDDAESTAPRPPLYTSPLYTGPTDADIACVPEVLKARHQWVLWRGVEKHDTIGTPRLNKTPIDPQTLTPASSIDPETWHTFTYALDALPTALEEWQCANPLAYRGGGIGFVFCADDPLVGIDLDHCRNPDTGTIDAWAQDILTRLDSYSEVSPSGTGVHIFVLGTVPRGRRHGAVEVYDQGRFFTVTGWHVPGTPPCVHDRADVLHAWYVETFRAGQAGAAGAVNGTVPDMPELLDDAAILDKLRHASNRAKFQALWAGDSSGYPSHSEADLALCTLLCIYSRNLTQLNRLFEQSGLMREKWSQQHGALTYGQRTIHAALRWQDKTSRTRSSPLAVAGEGSSRTPLPYSDTTNAYALVRAYGPQIRHCEAWGTWLVWQGTHWQMDDTGQLMRYAKTVVKQMASGVEALEEPAAIRALLAHVKSSLSTAKLRAMLDNAESEEPLAVRPEAFDCHPGLLNVGTGTIDLTTGTPHPHRPTDMLTKVLPLAYNTQAQCSTWEAFLWRVMGGSLASDRADDGAGILEARHIADARATRLIGFLQRAIGYSLTSSTREQCLFVLYGSGANGKSTFLEVLLALLGDYAQSTPSATLLVKDRHDGIPNDIARLRGARLVTAVEVGEGKRLNEELIKRLTGQDRMTARFLHGEFFDFLPEFKLWLACNHLPTIRGTDHAIWRRIKCVPFTVTIPESEQDKDLPGKLKTELPAILRWAVQGCLDWQQHGLGVPAEVQTATADYRASMDVVGRFIDDVCLVGDAYRVKASELYDAYKRWCEASGEPLVTLATFGNRLEDKGYRRRKIGTIWRLGVGLRSENN